MFRRGMPRAAPDADGASTTRPSATFYAALGANLRAFVEQHRRGRRVLRRSGAAAVGRRDRARRREAGHLPEDRARGVRCDRRAGRRRAEDRDDSHFQRFLAIREELRALQAANPAFAPAFPGCARTRCCAAVRAAKARLDRERGGARGRRPGERGVRADAAPARVCVSRAAAVAGESAGRRSRARADARASRCWPSARRACPRVRRTPTATRACRSPTLRDAAPLPPGASARRYFVERLDELATRARRSHDGDARVGRARARVFDDSRCARATRGFARGRRPGARARQLAPLDLPSARRCRPRRTIVERRRHDRRRRSSRCSTRASDASTRASA